MKPIGKSRSTFMTYFGHIARNGVKLPLNYPSWSDIPADTIDGIWEDIKVAAEINKRNRSMHGPPHRYGRTAFPIIREEMQEEGRKHICFLCTLEQEQMQMEFLLARKQQISYEREA